MKSLEPRYREAARRLVGPERRNGEPVSSAAAFFEALEPELRNLIGRVGLRAMEGRALRLAKSEHAILEELQVQYDGDGMAGGLTELVGRAEADTLESAVVDLAGHLVRLLASLLGEEITLRLLRRTCPEVELEETTLDEAPGGAE